MASLSFSQSYHSVVVMVVGMEVVHLLIFWYFKILEDHLEYFYHQSYNKPFLQGTLFPFIGDGISNQDRVLTAPGVSFSLGPATRRYKKKKSVY